MFFILTIIILAIITKIILQGRQLDTNIVI